MPRVNRQRTKYHHHHHTATDKTEDTGDLVSAPVSLLPSTENPTTNKSKKEKRVERHKKWMDKINVAQTQKKKEQLQQGRSTNKSALIRGMGGLQESLREAQAEIMAQHLLSLEKKPEKQQQKPTNRQNAPKSRKARGKAAIKEEKRFGQILKHPAFQTNPLATIRQHLANTLPQKD